jgi:hypothetical protein
MNTLKAFIEKNRPQSVRLSAEQIIKAARESGFEIEFPLPAAKSWRGWFFQKKQMKKASALKNRGLTINWLPADEKEFIEEFNIINAKEGLDYTFGSGTLLVEYEHCLGENAVEYTARIKNSHGMVLALEIVLEKIGVLNSVLVPTPEPIVSYPDDNRDGAPPKGTRLFLSRARELAQGCFLVETVLKEPTGKIYWEKTEWCWINHCGSSTAGPFSTEEEAKVAELRYEGGCSCGNPTEVKVRAFTVVYGEKVYCT